MGFPSRSVCGVSLRQPKRTKTIIISNTLSARFSSHFPQSSPATASTFSPTWIPSSIASHQTHQKTFTASFTFPPLTPHDSPATAPADPRITALTNGHSASQFTKCAYVSLLPHQIRVALFLEAPRESNHGEHHAVDEGSETFLALSKEEDLHTRGCAQLQTGKHKLIGSLHTEGDHSPDS